MNDPIRPEVKKIFWDSINELDSTLKQVRKNHAHGVQLLSRFDMLKQYNEVYVHEVTEFRNTGGSFTLMLLEKHLTIITTNRLRVRSKKNIEEYEPVMTFNVAVDMGKVFVKEETLSEKVLDVFTKADIDFKDFPKFSSKYFVVGENPDLVRQHFPKPLLETLSIAKGMNVEINGTLGLLRPQKNLSKEVLHRILHIGYRLTK